MSSEIKNIIKKSERYSGFTIFDEPQIFREFFKGKDYDIVQLHSLVPFNKTNIIGFCGQCSWIKGKLSSLDGDYYTDKMKVYGYEEFRILNGNKHCIDILVGGDW